MNPRMHVDVNDDEVATPHDALKVVNAINRFGVGNLPVIVASDANYMPPNAFLDVNGDGLLTSNDALQVINFLNRQNGNGEGEGEASVIFRLDTAASATAAQTPSVANSDGVARRDVELIFAGIGAHAVERSTLVSPFAAAPSGDDGHVNAARADQPLRPATIAVKTVSRREETPASELDALIDKLVDDLSLPAHAEAIDRAITGVLD